MNEQRRGDKFMTHTSMSVAAPALTAKYQSRAETASASGLEQLQRANFQTLNSSSGERHRQELVVAMELNSVLLTAGGSIGFFKLVNCGVSKLPIPETACRNAWKWRNICTSFTHSLITGIWAVLW